jgi:hypothetical protein
VALISLANIVAEAHENYDVPSGFTGVGLGGGGVRIPVALAREGAGGVLFFMIKQKLIETK